jgi:hypothetical protein
MWGVPGAVLSTPMLAISKIICDRVRPLMADSALEGGGFEPLVPPREGATPIQDLHFARQRLVARSARLDWFKRPFPGQGWYELARMRAEELAQHNKPEPAKVNWAKGSMEWQAEQEALKQQGLPYDKWDRHNMDHETANHFVRDRMLRQMSLNSWKKLGIRQSR